MSDSNDANKLPGGNNGINNQYLMDEIRRIDGIADEIGNIGTIWINGDQLFIGIGAGNVLSDGFDNLLIGLNAGNSIQSGYEILF